MSVSLGKIMEVIVGVTEKHLRDSTVTGHSQHRFMRGKSNLTNQISFFDKITCLVDHGKPVGMVVLDFWFLLLRSLDEPNLSFTSVI